MRFVRATFAVAVAFYGLLAIANCSLDGLSGGESDGGPSNADATEGPLDASQAVDQAKDAAGDSIPDADAGSMPDYADQNHPSGDGAAFPDGGHECYVKPTDHLLYCANGDSDKYNDRNIYAERYVDSGIVNKFVHNFSWFKCWAVGELHSGGNTTWYYTIGGQNAAWGWAPGNELYTPPSFDVDPSDAGLRNCDSGL